MAYEFERPIRAGDTDFTENVYTPAVTRWIATGAHDLRADAGLSYAAYEELGVTAPAVNVTVDLLSPMRMEDDVSIAITPVFGDTSITFEATGAVDGTTTFTGSLTMVFVDTTTDEPVTIPEAIRDAFAPYGDAR
jgi:acyl-CoA thioesterase FadM